MEILSRDELMSKWRASRDLQSLSNMLRVNSLALVQKAGSGHLGTSFSVMDVLLGIHYFEQGHLFPDGSADKYRVFSSKGHDAPALYAMNHFLGLIPHEGMILRRLGYLPGHPEIGSGGSITNTGSLGMGISKAKGFAAADFLRAEDSSTYVILGDGELQEGQIWESIADTSKFKNKVVAVVDGNAIQSDTWVRKTRDLGDLRARVEACGWTFIECDGHDFQQLMVALGEAKNSSQPTMILAHTTKGFGSPALSSFPDEGRFYHAHSGALTPELAEIVRRDLLEGSSETTSLTLDFSRSEKMGTPSMPNLWAGLLQKFVSQKDDLVVLDADLALDTGTYSVVEALGDRYIQVGIAEQDMVSMAGTMALSGLTPIVHSFATFLTMRPFEQIVNNASEGTRVVYVGFLAGIVPSAAGFSHQAVLDLAIMAAVPGMKIFEPATEAEAETALAIALSYEGPTYLRMNSVPPVIEEGEFIGEEEILGTSFGRGRDFLIFCSGAFSLRNALGALNALASRGFHGRVRTLANKSTSLEISDVPTEIAGPVLFLENGAEYLGTFSKLSGRLKSEGRTVKTVSINGFPVNGSPDEVSHHHGMDSDSFVATILDLIASLETK